MKYKVCISVGELFDKLSILQIKLEKIKDKKSLNYVKKEFIELDRTSKDQFFIVKSLYLKLYSINKKLWNLENRVRKLERKKQFGKHFIISARKIYKYNDQRATIKKKINMLTNSEYQEVKQHN